MGGSWSTWGLVPMGTTSIAPTTEPRMSVLPTAPQFHVPQLLPHTPNHVNCFVSILEGDEDRISHIASNTPEGV